MWVCVCERESSPYDSATHSEAYYLLTALLSKCVLHSSVTVCSYASFFWVRVCVWVCVQETSRGFQIPSQSVSKVTLSLNARSSTPLVLTDCWQQTPCIVAEFQKCCISSHTHDADWSSLRHGGFHRFFVCFTECRATRLQSCWHLWKWIELRIRGFVTNPICHLPKWSQIQDYMLVLLRGWWATVGLKPLTGAGFTFYYTVYTQHNWNPSV